MVVFITGATGFVGKHIVNQLTQEGHQVRCLVRSANSAQFNENPAVERHHGDILDPETLTSGLAGCDAVIHLVGIIRPFPQHNITFKRLHVEATTNIIQAAQQAGIKRYLHMSANGVHHAVQTSGEETYLTTKQEGEELVRNSHLDWTIFRPSLIYGSDGEFTRMLRQQVTFLPAIPVIGDGNYPLMPVSVFDIALAFTKALSNEHTIGKTYHCCGPDQCNYNDLLDLCARAANRRKPFKLHIPLNLMRRLTKYLEPFRLYPVTSDQITMLTNGNICDEANWYHDLHITATPLETGIKKALGH